MKGVGMSIKLVQQDRVAGYGIALGNLLYTLWRALAPVAARDPDLRQSGGRSLS